MLRVTIRGLLARKLRLALSAVAVVLGVAFVAGSLILTDTIRSTFDSVFTTANQGVAVQVRSSESIGGGRADIGDDNRAPLPASFVAKVRAVSGVSEAAGQVSGELRLVGAGGKAIGSTKAPTLGVNFLGNTSLSQLKLVQGRAPSGSGELVLDQSAFTGAGLKLGDEVEVLSHDAVTHASIVGVVKFGTSGNLAGATLVGFDDATAQKLLGTPGSYQDIEAAAQRGVSDDDLQGRVSAALGSAFDVRTGDEVAQDTSKSIGQGISFITTFLVVFALIALFVGGFVIANTFQVLVAQRTRELALLRALGASRRQVLATVLSEGAAVGAIGAVAGLALGVLLAIGLKALLKGFGLDLPSSGLDIKARTIVVSLLLGVAVSAASAVLPARRAGRVPPVAAMRDSESIGEEPSSLRRRIGIGVVFLLVGVVLLVVGLSGKGNVTAVGIGALLIVLAVTTLSPLVSSVIVSGLGAWLPRAAGTVGRLARDNAVRNPRRTSSTASALMIGLAVVGAFTVLLSSFTASTKRIINDSLSAQVVAYDNSFSGAGIPTALEAAAARAPGVTGVAGLRTVRAEIAGGSHGITVVPTSWRSALRVFAGAGRLDVGTGDLLVSQTQARKHNWTVGEALPARSARGGSTTVHIAGTFEDNVLIGDYIVGQTTFAADTAAATDDVILVSGTGPPADVAAAVKTAIGTIPGIAVSTQQQYLHRVEQQVNQLLSLVIALLALAIFIAGLGVLNTMALSVIERTREIGLLRAVGLTRRQLKWVIRWESVLICTYGALLGLVVGAGLGSALVESLRDQGVSVLSLGLPILVACVVVAAVGGVIAGSWPARRAARMDPLAAISSA